LVKGILAYCRRAFCAKMRNGCVRHHLIHFYRPFFYSFSTGNRRARMPRFAMGLFLRPSLLALRPAALDRWPEVELSPEAQQALGDFREAERRRREYCGRRF
jgi:hypothetical protein